MSKVEVPLVLPTGTKQLQLETDPQSGHTTIRVEGRAVAKALAPEEDHREFLVDGVKTVVRRRSPDEFDVDYARPKVRQVAVDPAPAPRVLPPPRALPPPRRSPPVQDPAVDALSARPKLSGKGKGVLTVIAVLFIIRLAGAIFGRRHTTEAAMPKLEVSVFECSVTTHARFEASGVVKNNSAAPVNLTARVSLPSDRSGSGAKDYFSSRVNPQSLQPGATGNFAIEDGLPGSITFETGTCRLEPFLEDSGREIGYTPTGSAAKAH